MITNFESITSELTKEEYKIIPLLIRGLENHNSLSPITAADICSRTNNYISEKNLNIPKLTGVRLRKLVNFLRCNSILPVIATREGYYVSYGREDIIKQVESLKQRAEGIQAAADGLWNYYLKNNNESK
jgi:hypothetical protein